MAFNLFKKSDTKKKPAKKEPVASPSATEVTEEKKDAVPAPVVPVSGTSVLKHLHVSEKSSMGQQMNQYTFLVELKASKSEIAKEVENRYNVSVQSVRVNKRKGKSRRIGLHRGTTARIKKAIVTVADGQTITGA